jgi:hypothetical protein
MNNYKTIEEVEILETIETIVEYKMKEANKEKKNHEELRDSARERGDEETEKFFNEASRRDLARWGAFNDIFEAIQLYK